MMKNYKMMKALQSIKLCLAAKHPHSLALSVLLHIRERQDNKNCGLK